MKRNIFLTWVFGVIGGIIINHGLWGVVFYNNRLLWLTVVVGILFALLGLLFSIHPQQRKSNA